MLNRRSGILLHITSLYSKYGIGDLGENAYHFVDFLEEANQTLWQILPINPTSYGDSPYQGFSTFAGNPHLICPDKLTELGLLKEDDLLHVPSFEVGKVDYGAVIEFKDELNRQAYCRFIECDDPILKKDYQHFLKVNADWLDDYSLFMALKFHFISMRKQAINQQGYARFAHLNQEFLTKDQINDYYYGAVWHSWPTDIAMRKEKAVKKWREILKEEVEYHQFLQFIFATQFKKLKRYANKKGIDIIGDIPIFVAFDSADCWANRSFFMLEENGNPTAVAGVPPDYFSEDGQLWGNPLYDWEVLAQDDYAWWVRRVQKALEFCNILRIDHFRGFESYWQVPYGKKTAKIGKWIHGPGRDLFHAIKRQLGELPIIAEDLGIITPEVEKLRDELNLPGMKVIQFGFDANRNNANLPHNFKTSNVVVYTGTHDNDTTVGWYQQASDAIQDQFRRYLNVSGEDVAWSMIQLAFFSVAKMAIIPMQDVLSQDATYRMNTPGIAFGNWQFRLAPDVVKKKIAQRLKYLSELTDRNIIDIEKKIK